MKKYKIEKEFEYEGLKCLVIGQNLGHRCGYVGVDKDHPLHGVDYKNAPLYAHGYVNYSNTIYFQSADLWFFGFDCGHYGDSQDFELIKELSTEEEYDFFVQMYNEFPLAFSGIIRTTEYVEKEVIELAKQINGLR